MPSTTSISSPSCAKPQSGEATVNVRRCGPQPYPGPVLAHLIVARNADNHTGIELSQPMLSQCGCALSILENVDRRKWSVIMGLRGLTGAQG